MVSIVMSVVKMCVVMCVLSCVSARHLARRQAGSLTTAVDGTHFRGQLPLAGNDRAQISAIGGADLDTRNRLAATSGGLQLDTARGHSLSVIQSQLPGVGTRLTGAGSVNLLEGPHRVDANAFAARTSPLNPHVPNFNTYGGGVDYSYKGLAGAGINVAHTPLFQKTDYDVMGKMNLYRGRDSSLDFNAGLSKSVSPFIPKSSWQPSAGFSFSKYF